jgi:hypothetical protein
VTQAVESGRVPWSKMSRPRLRLGRGHPCRAPVRTAATPRAAAWSRASDGARCGAAWAPLGRCYPNPRPYADGPDFAAPRIAACCWTRRGAGSWLLRLANRVPLASSTMADRFRRSRHSAAAGGLTPTNHFWRVERLARTPWRTLAALIGKSADPGRDRAARHLRPGPRRLGMVGGPAARLGAGRGGLLWRSSVRRPGRAGEGLTQHRRGPPGEGARCTHREDATTRTEASAVFPRVRLPRSPAFRAA